MNILNGYLVAGMCGLQKTRKSGANMGHGYKVLDKVSLSNDVNITVTDLGNFN